jgi:hypothetical protein
VLLLELHTAAEYANNLASLLQQTDANISGNEPKYIILPICESSINAAAVRLEPGLRQRQQQLANGIKETEEEAKSAKSGKQIKIQVETSRCPYRAFGRL